MRKKMKILFLCSTDSCRGPMARALLQAMAQDRLDVFSAGIAEGTLHPAAVQAMSDAGYDIASHRSTRLADLDADGFDMVITLGEEAGAFCRSTVPSLEEERKRLLSGVPILLRWQIPDPARGSKDEGELKSALCILRDDLGARIEGLLDHGTLAALRLERSRLQRFADMLDDGIIIHDAYRNIFLVNEALERITGRSRDEIIGRDCHEVFPSHGLCGSSCRFRHDHGKEAEGHTSRVTYITPSGVKKQLKLTARPMEIDSGVQGVLAVVRDLTEIRELRSRLRERRRFHGMVGVSNGVQEVFRTIESVSVSDYPVLVTGESGTGKELVALAIHNESSRKAGPFVPVNCGALPENIIESELFGHVRGAFTGAIRDKKGRFELAHRGTLFLDEVAELSPGIQVKLLRVLQEKKFERVGGEKSIFADVRIISATNRDLRGMIMRDEFREDLYYRLCVVPIALPPLRERREDIPYLVEQILERIGKESGKQISEVEERALDFLLAHLWPGNIRELINALQFASVRCRGDIIRAEDLPPEIRRGTMPADPTGSVLNEPGPGPARRGRAKLTREAVDRALAECGGNKVRAARMLGVGRATLYRFLGKVNG